MYRYRDKKISNSLYSVVKNKNIFSTIQVNWLNQWINISNINEAVENSESLTLVDTI